MSWNLDGSYFESCSCEVVCPCTASLSFGATYDRCKVALVFNIKSGEVEGIDVSGLTVARSRIRPKVMSEGNWRLGVFIDEAASDEQAEKLGAVFSGALGGPMEALGPLVGENLGVERPHRVPGEGLSIRSRSATRSTSRSRTSCRSGCETGEPAKLTGIFHPASSELTVAHATRSKIDAFGIQFEAKAGFSKSEFLLGGMSAADVSGPRRSGWASGQLAVAFSAVRARLGLVVAALRARGPRLVVTADRMDGMDVGPGTDLGTLGWFLGIWVVMMAAMMFPSVAPTVALYSQHDAARGGLSRAAALRSGYLLVWGAAGLVGVRAVPARPSLLGGDSGVGRRRSMVGRGRPDLSRRSTS